MTRCYTCGALVKIDLSQAPAQLVSKDLEEVKKLKAEILKLNEYIKVIEQERYISKGFVKT